MKKLALNLVALFTLMVFSGCNNAIDERFKDEPNLSALTGILTEQKLSHDKYAGTHLLTDDLGNVTALKSLSINLGGLQYLDNNVEVTGVQNPNAEVFEVTGIKVLEVLSDEKVVLAKFVPYQNTELGFQLDYSDDWTVEEFSDRVYFRAPSDPSITEGILVKQEAFAYQPITKEDGTTDTPLEAYEAKLRLTKEFVDAEFVLSQIGPDKLNALKFEKEDLNDVHYFVYRAGYIYTISFVPGSSENLANNLAVFNKMVSSFMFIGFDIDGVDVTVDDSEDINVESADLPELDMELTSFESLPYSFKADYPAKWYYAGENGSKDVLWKYGFSDEPLDDDNEIVSMEVISGDLPQGTIKNIGDQKFIEISTGGGTYEIYTTAGSYNYRVKGPKEYKDLIFSMAASIAPVVLDEQ